MLIRREQARVVAIGQASHAWLSGQLARAWGNDRFDAPEPREEVCLAAEQHDVGMAEWDLTPRLDQTKRPQSFMEMALADHLGLWSAAPAKLLTQSRYAALLVSLHGHALYERRDVTRLTRREADAVRTYLARERRLQDRLIELVGADRGQLKRNQRLLWTWDGLSLALCLRWREHVAEEVPVAGDACASVRLEPVGEEPARLFCVDPWPFAWGALTVRCEGRELAERYESERELQRAFEKSPSVGLVFTLIPASRQ